MDTRPLPSELLQLFLFVVEEGSFSAAAQRVGRTQPAVSYAIKGLEEELGMTLFDRRGRRAEPTEHARALLDPARRALAAVDAFQGQARRLGEGVESLVRLAVDQLYDLDQVRCAVREFTRAWPDVALELRTEALGGVVASLRDGAVDFGIANQLTLAHDGLARAAFASVPLVALCAPSHPLARLDGPLGPDELAGATQLVVTDRTELTRGVSIGIQSARTWRFADLHTKHRFLLDGFGWGSLPLHMARGDLARGDLVQLELADPPGAAALFLVHRPSRPPGPAARWLLDALASPPTE